MLKKKQVNLYSYFFLPSIGGAQVCAHSMAITYRELGYDVNLITSKNSYIFLKNKKLPYNVKSIGNIPLGLIKNFKVIEKFFSLFIFKKLKNEINYDSINIIFGLWPFGALISNFSKKIKFLIRPTGDDIQTDLSVNYGLARDKKISNILKKIIEKNENYLAISETVKNNFSNEKKIIISTPGIHSNYFDKFIYKNIESKYKKKDRLIISIGRNHPKKCFHHLIKLAEIMPKNYKFLIIGKDTKKLERKIKNPNDLNRFKFIEEIVPSLNDNDYYFPSKKLLEYFSQSHYFVYPTKTETYANVALEAMSSYVPCILSNVPGNNDTITADNGLLYKFGDINEIKEKILFLEKNSSIREKIILNGKKFSQENDWKIKCNEIIKRLNDSLLS